MSDACCRHLYEHSALLGVTGATIRPGGLELTHRAMARCTLPPGATIVDVGCGTGATVAYLRREFRLNAFGLDRAGRFDVGREDRLPLVQGDAIRLPFRDGCMSAVICECVLSLLHDPDAAWREFHRVLTGRGLAVVADIYLRAEAQAFGVRAEPPTSCLKGAETRAALESRLRRNGFALLDWEDHSRALNRLAAELVFACGSMKAFWGATGACTPDAGDASRLLPARPGYFVCMARREDVP
jgi:arsenite methyltransferase